MQPSEISVLLVDDELLSRTVVGNLLRKCGYLGAWPGSCVAGGPAQALLLSSLAVPALPAPQ